MYSELYNRVLYLYLKFLPKWRVFFTFIYVNCFKNYSVNSFINYLYRIFEKLIGLKILKIYTHEQYTNLFNQEYIVIKNNRNGISPERIYDITATPSLFKSEIPNLFLSNLENVTIFGGCDSICDFDNNIFIDDRFFNLDPRLSPASQILFGTYNNYSLIRTKFNHGMNVNYGIMVVAFFSSNYYHLLYEVLPKLFILQKMNIEKDIPLLVDECIKNVKQYKEAFDCIYDGSRPIIWISSKQYYKVKNLYYLSSINLLPGQVKKINEMNYIDYGFDFTILNDCRQLYLSKLDLHINNIPKRIFLSRKGHNRRNYNEDELFAVAEKYGFIRLLPESLSFSNQITYFYNADIIIGASGAAFSNIMFCHECAISICFYSMKIKSPTFTIGSLLSKSKLVYLLGSKVMNNSSSYSIHSDFRVNPNDLDRLLNKIC